MAAWAVPVVCCDDKEALDLPRSVIEMVARYRRMRAQQGFGWGEDALPEMFRWARFSRLGPLFARFAATGDWPRAVREAVGDHPPPGLVLVTLDDDGVPGARFGPPLPLVEGVPTVVEVVAVSDAERDLSLSVDGDRQVVRAGGACCWVVDVESESGPAVVGASGEIDGSAAVRAAQASTLRLVSPDGAR